MWKSSCVSRLVGEEADVLLDRHLLLADVGDRRPGRRLADGERRDPVEVAIGRIELVDQIAVVARTVPTIAWPSRMRMPSSSGSRNGAPHSSQSTAKVDENGASQAGQRRRIAPPQAHVAGTSSSESSNQRRAPPQSRQNAVQCPSTFRRSSRSQSAALPTRLHRIGTDGRSAVVSIRALLPYETRGRAVAIARVAEPSGSLQEVKEWGLDREDLLEIYRNMLVTRGVEERGHILYRQGKIPGSFYTGRGNEASAVGVATAMGPDDVGTPLHRDMGVHITRGVEPWRIFAQYMGRADGPTHGKDGNVHMADARLGLLAMVSHLPAMLPVAVGCALAFRIREEQRVAVAWYGEGASARGDTHEGMNFAGVGGCRSCSSATTTSGRTRRRRISSTRSSTSPTARRRTGSTASSSTAPTCSQCTARRSARSTRHAPAAGRR